LTSAGRTAAGNWRDCAEGVVAVLVEHHVEVEECLG
jgi:hypothetical protein